MPSAIPSPLPPWARFLLHVAEATIPSFLLQPLEYIGNIDDIDAAASNEWRHVELEFVPYASTLAADRQVTTFDIVNITQGLVDNSWTAGDYSTVDGALRNLVLAWMAFCSPELVATELRYYRRGFSPMPTLPLPAGEKDKPYGPSGPPDYVHALGIAGTDLGLNAPTQVAVTSTEKTTYRRHWGRNYWPGPTMTHLNSANGQLQAATVDALTAAVANAYQVLANAEFFVVVPSTQIAKQPTRALLGVTTIQVDSVFDVVRRRRAYETAYRKTAPV